ncbi:MAG: single-stranded DNA-binding protein [Clostridia bacterium]|nr:single-stranded DNA-binding protein [Clostridia bacterium]MDD4375178.1 single-stranded DNA-binding protein [Clostridia bacterium]
MEQAIENNIVKMGGTVASVLELSHEIYGEKFYRFHIEINRLSGQNDKLPIIISERLIDIDDFEIGKIIYIEGQYRSYNQLDENNKSRLILSVFVKEIEQLEVSESVKTINELTVIGTVCKAPIYRKTPLGRDIADLLLAVNRSYNKSDYIPCIVWGRNAKYCENLETGTTVKVVGRIQARKYEKKYDDGKIEERVAYEVSVSKFEILKDNSMEEQKEDTN